MLSINSHRGEYFSYYFTLLAASGAALTAAYRSGATRYDRWPMLLLSTSLALWAAGLLSATVQVSFLSRINTNTNYTYLLFVSYGLPLLYIVSSYGDEYVSRLQKTFDGILMCLLVLMFYMGIQDVLDSGGEKLATSGRWVNFALDIENVFLSLIILLRACTVTAARQKLFFNNVLAFLVLYTACIALHNHWQYNSDPRVLQFIGQSIATVPFTTLIVLINRNTGNRDRRRDPSPILRRVSLSIGPSLMLAAVFVLSFGINIQHGILGVSVVAVAMLCYIARTIQTQYWYVETKDALVGMVQTLEQMSLTDATTGIANRRAFDQTFEKLAASSIRESTALGVLMIDIDFFKKYNDTYGHQAGDGCLRHVAALIAQQLHRPTDFFARYGGEEFAVLLPGISAEGVRAVAQRLTDAVSTAKLVHAHGIDQCVTISVGIANRDTPAADPIATLRRADEALYRAKEAGRNRLSE